MEIITGYTGKKHITPEHDRDIHIGTYGDNSYVLSTGMKMEAEVSSNNEIKIRDGVLIHQGCAASIKKNTYDSLQIVNGSQGMKRIDLIIARYKKDKNTGIETLQLEVLKGTPSETEPMSPSYISGDIQAGDTVSDMPMYKITIEGLNIVAVDQLFTILPSMATIREDMTTSTETLKSGVRLQRMGKLRILNLVDTSSAADGTIVNLAAGDRPANYVFAPAIVRGQTYPDFFISVTPVSAGTGKVGLFRGANVQMQYNGYICSQIAWMVD